VIEGEAIAGGVGAQASDPPVAVGGDVETQGILAARILDVAPRLAAAELAPAGLAELELGGRGGGQPVVVEPGRVENRAVGGQDGRHRAARAAEHEREVLGHVVGASQLAGCDLLAAVLHVGLVAGVAIGDGEPCDGEPEPAGPGMWVRSDTTLAKAP
jgi:hypothetical protein